MKDSCVSYGTNGRVTEMRLDTARMAPDEKKKILSAVIKRPRQTLTAFVSDGENITPYPLSEISEEFLAADASRRQDIMRDYSGKFMAAQEVIIWTKPTITKIENPSTESMLSLIEKYAGDPNAEIKIIKQQAGDYSLTRLPGYAIPSSSTGIRMTVRGKVRRLIIEEF